MKPLLRNRLPQLVLTKTLEIAHDWKRPFVDIGCGKGDLLYQLKDNFNLIGLGLDYSEKQLAYVDNTYIPFIRGDAFSLPFRDNSIFTITCFNTLYNYPNVKTLHQFFREMIRTIASEGRIIVDVRNKKNPILKIKYWLHMKIGNFPTVSHDTNELKNFFYSLGCSLENSIAIKSYNFLSPWGFILVFKKEKNS